MLSLTHQERESIIKAVHGFKKETVSDDVLVRDISALLTTISTGTGIERVFYQNTLELINYIRNNQREDGSAFVRAALCHILSNYNNSQNRPWLLVLQELSFVSLQYLLHESLSQ